MKTKMKLAVAATALTSSLANASGLDSQLDNIFDDMANYTPPGVYESQRRGVIAGGRLTTKARIMSESFVNVQTPSWKGGCGGIDMFGGSFSFINADQLVQLLRTVAANAKGYAFQIAMKNMSPQIASTIAEFQEKVQKLNQLSANSCQLAQGIVNDSIDAFAGKDKHVQGRTGVTLGTFADDFAGIFGDGSDQAKTLSATLNARPDLKKQFYGNMTWIGMQTHNAEGWFVGGDQEMLESMMSLVGFISIPEPSDDADITNSSSPQPVTSPPTLKLRDLILGSTDNTFTVYSCGGDTELCMTPTTVNRNVKGFKERIREQLLEPGTGIVDKIRAGNAAGALTNTQKNFLANMPQGVGAMIFRIAAKNGGRSAEQFVQQSINAIAVQMAYDFGYDTALATQRAVGDQKATWAMKAVDLIGASKDSLTREYESLVNEYGDLSTIMERYEKAMQMSESVRISAMKNRGNE